MPFSPTSRRLGRIYQGDVMLRNLQAIVLAAGQSTPFNTDKSKLIEKICGQEIIVYTTRLLESLCIPTTLVVGYQKELVQEVITKAHQDKIHFVTQEEQHGTAHAIVCARDSFKEEHILIMNGDMPLVPKELIIEALEKHVSSECDYSKRQLADFKLAYQSEKNRKLNDIGRVELLEHKVT